jgi:hypothetical protein
MTLIRTNELVLIIYEPNFPDGLADQLTDEAP